MPVSRNNRGPNGRLLTGAFHPTLEAALLEHLEERVSSQPLSLTPVIVPTNLLGIRLSRLLAERTGGHANVRFQTLKDFALSVAGTPLPDGRSLLPNGADEVALRRLLENGLAEGGYFERIAERPGLTSALLAAIGDLKESCYDVDGLADAAGSAGLLKKGRDNKFTELIRIWRAYEDRLEQDGWADTQDAMTAAAVAAERVAQAAGRSSGTGSDGETAGGSGRGRTAPEDPERGTDDGNTLGGPLTVYGFYDLNPLQKRLIGACVSASGADVFFPYVDNESFHYARPALGWFEQLGLQLVRLQEPDAREVPLPETTRIISAPGGQREVREAVRELTRVLDESGAQDGARSGGGPDKDLGEGAGEGTEGTPLALQDIGVLMRSSDGYSDQFLEELTRVGATPYVQSPPPLLRTREGRALIKLAEAAREDFARVELMEFFNLADLDMAGLGAGDGESSGTEEGAKRRPGQLATGDWNKASMLAGVTSGASRWLERLSGLIDRLERSREGGRFASTHRHLLEPTRQLMQLVSVLAARLGGIPARARVDLFLEEIAGAYCAVTRNTPERATVLAAARGLRALDGIAGEISLSYFLELLRDALDEPDAREERFGRGGPTVLNIMAARGLMFRAVVLPGLVERQFPATHRQDPILLDSERERLNAARGDDPLSRLPIRSTAVDEERLLFHLAVNSASDVLLLTFPRLEPSTARPRVPSVFLLRVLETMTGDRYDYEKLDASELVERIPLSRRFPENRRRALTRDEFDGCSVMRALTSGDESEVAYLVGREGPLPRRLHMEEVRWSSPYFTEYDGVADSDESRAAIEKLLGLERGGYLVVPPTTLEDYARCPFAFFMRHVLDVEQLAEPEEAMSLTPLERGSLYHDVLESFLRRARDEGELPLSAKLLDRLVEEAVRAGRSEEWSLAAIEGARELELRGLVSSLSLWLAYEALGDSPYIPAHFEARFGGKVRRGDDPELSMEEGLSLEELGIAALRLSGRIDRIDMTPDGARARVIDYKTGKPESKGEKVLDRGRRLQLPVYLLATEEMLRRKGAATEVDTAEYLYVMAPGGLRKLTFTKEELRAAEEDLGKAIGLIMHGVTAGLFFAYPPDANNCRWCDYADACGSTATALATMKNGDRKARFFVQDMVEIK